MTAEDRLRREGMADAAVLLTAKHVVRTMSLNDWARALDLNEMDVQHAVQRLKARASRGKTPPPTDRKRRMSNLQGQTERDRIVDTLTRLGGRVVCEHGRASTKLREACGTDADIFQFATWLKQLEDEGRIARIVKGKRTFSIAVTVGEVA